MIAQCLKPSVAPNSRRPKRPARNRTKYTYDGRGNQTERSVLGGDTLYFDYNSRNLITRIDSTEGGFTPNTFDYNALGQRISKADSDGLTYYVWDGLNITHEHDGSGTITRRYTHGHTPIHGVFSLIDVEDDQGDHYFYHLDQVGGVHRLTDASETTDTTYEFSPFGRMLEETTGNATNDFTFPGSYAGVPGTPDLRLSPTRLYSASAGSFLTRDWPTAGSAAGPLPQFTLGSLTAASLGTSLYAFVGAAPMVLADPTGLVADAHGFNWHHIIPYWFTHDCQMLVYIPYTVHQLIHYQGIASDVSTRLAYKAGYITEAEALQLISLQLSANARTVAGGIAAGARSLAARGLVGVKASAVKFGAFLASPAGGVVVLAAAVFVGGYALGKGYEALQNQRNRNAEFARLLDERELVGQYHERKGRALGRATLLTVPEPTCCDGRSITEARRREIAQAMEAYVRRMGRIAQRMSWGLNPLKGYRDARNMLVEELERICPYPYFRGEERLFG